MKTRPTRTLAALVAVGGLLLAGCGDDGDDATPATDAPSTEAPAATTPATTADTTPTTDMGGDMMGAYGPACSAVPADGEGSFGGMADDPAATAASNNPLLSTLVTAVTEAGLVDTLNGEGPFTIFAPTNDAFAAIPPADLEAVLADQELLTSILTFHVIAGESLSVEDLVAAGSATTVNGGELTFEAGDDDGLVVNGVEALCMNVPTANATVHIIGEVLMPEMEATPPTTEGGMGDAMMGAYGPACSAVPADGEGSFGGMADDPAATAASNNPLLSTLVTAVTEAGLVDTLNGEGPFTIFAPTNDAFAAIPPADLEAVLADTDLLTSILTFHVIAGESLSVEDLVAAGSATTVNGGELTFEAGDDDGLVVNGVEALCMNVPTANATVHIIGEVLMPDAGGDMGGDAMMGAYGPACSAVPADGEGSFSGMADDPAATAASNNPVLSTLVTAVTEAGLVDTLNGEGPFTIFAPTNDAFAALPPADLEAVLADPDLLTSVLTFHVIAGEQLDVAALVEAGSATTVNGGELTFEAGADDGLIVNGVDAVCMNVPTANATVHIIDGVLLPDMG